MKKILTLLIALGAIAGAQAQTSRYPSDRNHSRDVILGNSNGHDNGNSSRYGYSYSFTARERDQQVDRIDREYDQRIRQVQRDRRINSYEKRQRVQKLEESRRNEIRKVWERYKSRNNQYRDGDYHDNRKW